MGGNGNCAGVRGLGKGRNGDFCRRKLRTRKDTCAVKGQLSISHKEVRKVRLDETLTSRLPYTVFTWHGTPRIGNLLNRRNE